MNLHSGARLFEPRASRGSPPCGPSWQAHKPAVRDLLPAPALSEAAGWLTLLAECHALASPRSPRCLASSALLSSTAKGYEGAPRQSRGVRCFLRGTDGTAQLTSDACALCSELSTGMDEYGWCMAPRVCYLQTTFHRLRKTRGASRCALQRPCSASGRPPYTGTMHKSHPSRESSGARERSPLCSAAVTRAPSGASAQFPSWAGSHLAG